MGTEVTGTPGSRRWLIPEGSDGDRLDRHVAGRLGISRAQARYLLEKGRVYLDGKLQRGKAKGRMVLAGSEVLVEEIALPPALRPRLDPALAARVQELGRGPGWLAVDKPPDCGVHPLRADQKGTLLNGIIDRYPGLWGVGEGGLRSGVVHRLDVDTSGAVLFADRQTSWEALRGAFAAGQVEKRYRAVVAGRLQGSGEVELSLAVTRRSPARVRAFPVGAEPPGLRTWRTHLAWISMVAVRRASLVEVRPTTGFLHQIRVTLAYLGHPVLGDTTYGGMRSSPWPRQLLHAACLRWEGSMEIDVESPEPADFQHARENLGLTAIPRRVGG